MERLIEFIHARLHLDLSLTELAAVVGLSQFHFARLLRRRQGRRLINMFCLSGLHVRAIF
jgi:AraC family transcriptional regulator